jgi:hypothetical protein
MSDIDELKTLLTATRKRLMRAVSGVSEQQFKRRPEPSAEDAEPWCIAELLAHILDFEQLWTGRIAQALVAPESRVTPSDDEQHEAARRAGRGAPVPQLIHGLLATHRELDKLVGRAEAEGGLEHTVLHPTRGRLTVAWMIEVYGIEHLAEHTATIEELRAVVGAGALEVGS